MPGRHTSKKGEMKSGLLQMHGVLALALLSFSVPQPIPDPHRPEIYVQIVGIRPCASKDDCAIGEQEVEVKFAVQPLETKILFLGDPRTLSAGDYVKIHFDGPRAKVGDADLKSKIVTWKF